MFKCMIVEVVVYVVYLILTVGDIVCDLMRCWL